MKAIGFDFQAGAEKAQGMTNDQIHYALNDIIKTLPSADAMDRETGQDRGGWYRDEASVLRAEQKRRQSLPTCEQIAGW